MVAFYNREKGDLNPKFSGDGIRIIDPTPVKASFGDGMDVAVDIRPQVYLLNTITQNEQTYPCLTILDAGGDLIGQPFKIYKDFAEQPEAEIKKFIGKRLITSKDDGLYIVGEMHYWLDD